MILKKYIDLLDTLNNILSLFDLHFGYRVVDEIVMFMYNAIESKKNKIIDFENLDEIFDLAVATKILPKFHGSIHRLEKPLLLMLHLSQNGNIDDNLINKDSNELFNKILSNSEDTLNKVEIITNKLSEVINKTNNYKYRYTATKCLRMLRDLYEHGFTSYI